MAADVSFVDDGIVDGPGNGNQICVKARRWHRDGQRAKRRKITPTEYTERRELQKVRTKCSLKFYYFTLKKLVYLCFSGSHIWT